MRAFVSYSNIDKEFVIKLAMYLKTRGKIDIWLDEWETDPGKLILEKIQKGILESDVFILILSPDSVYSKWVEYEWKVWLTLQIEEEKNSRGESTVPHRRMIPILYKECERPVFIRSMEYIEVNDLNYEDKLNQLIEYIKGDSKELCTEEIKNLKKIPEGSVSRKEFVLNLLESLLEPQFNKVVYLYGLPSSCIPYGNSQTEIAIQLIKYAEQKDGETLSTLVDLIYKVADHLKDNSNFQKKKNF